MVRDAAQEAAPHHEGLASPDMAGLIMRSIASSDVLEDGLHDGEWPRYFSAPSAAQRPGPVTK